MKPRADLAIEEVDGELIVLDKTAGTIHQLNATASFVWNCMSDGLVADDIAKLFADEFDVAANIAMSDTQAALAQFDDLSLVSD